MRSFPIVPTILVVLAVTAMVSLGVWQLDRANQKRALLSRIDAAVQAPEMAFPAVMPANPESLLFRRASFECLAPVAQPPVGGVGPSGKAGWRHIVRCRTDHGQGLLADIGWSADFRFRPAWAGGPVRGIIAEMPSRQSALERWLRSKPATELVLISVKSAPGLAPSTPPSRADIPDNHIAYAVQWFFFAAVALVIYWLAVWRRRG